jgi:hypothetical protein
MAAGEPWDMIWFLEESERKKEKEEKISNHGRKWIYGPKLTSLRKHLMRR